MNQDTVNYAGFTPRPTGTHLAWAIAMISAVWLGAAAGGLISGFTAKYFSWPVAHFIGLGAGIGAVLAGGGALYVGFIRRHSWSWKEFGFTRPTHSLWHLTWWIPATVVAGGIGAMHLGTAMGLSPNDESSDSSGFSLGIAAGITIFVGTAVLLPLIEEIVFRRILMDWFDARLPTWAASTITTVIFAVMHISPVIMVYIIFLGTSLILARLWFRSLWGSFLVHAANNALVTVIALLAL